MPTSQDNVSTPGQAPRPLIFVAVLAGAALVVACLAFLGGWVGLTGIAAVMIVLVARCVSWFG